MDTFCECYNYNVIDMKSNVNINRKYVCLKFVIVDSRIYIIVVTLQFQWGGAFFEKVVPFKLNKFKYYIVFCCFIYILL